jgi:hypothetical protein
MREVRCPACNTLNRFKRYSVSRIPWCGKCKAALPEPKSLKLLRQVYRGRRRAALVAYVAVLVAPIAFFAWIGSGSHAMPQPPVSRTAAAELCTPESRPLKGEYGHDFHQFYVAPFKVNTAPGVDYFIKLENTDGSDNHFWFFARGGEPMAADVPLGTYVLKYAFGKQWCGISFPFGKDTVAKKGRTALTFRREYDGYSGNFVTLIAERGGNFPTSYIPASEF